MKHTYVLYAQNTEVDNIKVDGTLCYEKLENLRDVFCAIDWGAQI
jgi:hypothetical protein